MFDAAIKKSSIAILVIGIMAMFTPDADAGCIGNPPFCASYIKGSTICQGLKNGLGKKKFCLTQDDCGEVMCALGGTFDATTGEPNGDCNDTNACFPTPSESQSLNCAITATAVCANHGGGTGGVGQPFSLEAVLTGTADQANCFKTGQCLFTIPFDLTPDDFQCQNRNWTVVDSFANKFKGKACYCSGIAGGVNEGTSNPDLATVFTGLCADGFTQALCITEVCELNGTVYECNDVPQVACTP